jgi:hypothetical protein
LFQLFPDNQLIHIIQSLQTLNPDQFLRLGAGNNYNGHWKRFCFTLLDINENLNFELGRLNAVPALN